MPNGTKADLADDRRGCQAMDPTDRPASSERTEGVLGISVSHEEELLNRCEPPGMSASDRAVAEPTQMDVRNSSSWALVGLPRTPGGSWHTIAETAEAVRMSSSSSWPWSNP